MPTLNYAIALRSGPLTRKAMDAMIVDILRDHPETTFPDPTALTDYDLSDREMLWFFETISEAAAFQKLLRELSRYLDTSEYIDYSKPLR